MANPGPTGSANEIAGTQRGSLFNQRLKKFAGESFNRRMVGFTLCRAWVYVSFFNTAMLLFAENPTETIHSVYICSLVALILTLVACAWLNGQLERFFMTGLGRAFPAFATVTGSLVLMLANRGSTWGIVAVVASGVLTGIGSGLILVYWGRVYSTTGGPASAAEASLAFLLATLLVPVFAIVPLPVQVAIIAILPILSSILLVREFDTLDHAPYLREIKAPAVQSSARNGKDAAGDDGRSCPIKTDVERLALRNLVKVSVSSLVFGSAVGIIRTLYSSQSALADTFATNLIMPLSGLIAAAIVIGLLLFSRRLDLAFTYRPVVIFMTVSCLILPLTGGHYYSAYVLTLLGYFIFEILNWVMMADITFRYRMSAYKVYGLGRAAVSAGVLVGELIGLLFKPYGDGIPIEVLYVISLVLVLMMVITYTLTLTERDVARITRLESRPFKLSAKAMTEVVEDSPEAESEAGAAHELTMDERVHLLALRNGIEGRAYDVLLLMAKGRTAARIEQELYISRGTVNTYSHKVYQKLGIHSRQELFDLLDSVKEDQA